MVLTGSIDYEYGDEQLRLDVGDCMYADGSVEHTLNNPGGDTAEVLVVWVPGSVGGSGANGGGASHGQTPPAVSHP